MRIGDRVFMEMKLIIILRKSKKISKEYSNLDKIIKILYKNYLNL